MNTERNKDEERIYTEALSKPLGQRQAYIERACGDDKDLLDRVRALLKARDEAGSFLNASSFDVNVTLDTSALSEGPGTKIGHYELLEQIGEGGMGLVYLAQQKEPVRRKVVLKIVKPGMDSKHVIARFEAERQVLAILDHPNIAHVFDAGTTEMGRPYFVMEYVKGMSITRYCDEKKLNIEQRLRLFEQVCEGIHHAHQKGIIHRDLKPSNILVSVHGDKAVPKIIDFGIAKAVTQPLTDKTFVTFQGQLLGTPEYMSPEQVDLATQDIDTRSDIYSLGVVLYELLAGVLPFEEASFGRLGFAEIQRTIREVEPASPSMRLTSLGEKARTIAASRGTQVVPLARRLHRELEWIPLKAMRKDRCRRYRSASELADDIHNYLTGRPLIAGPETAIYRVKKFVNKHAGSVVTAAVVAIAIILGLVISTAMYFRAEDARQKESVARTHAEQAQQAEEEQRKVAEQKSEELRRSNYVNTIQLADAKHREGNTRRVRELLESCPQDLRGWEWDRINHVLDQSVMSFVAHEKGLYSMALSPDGKRIVTGGWDKVVKIWDIATGKEQITLRAHAEWINCVEFSPDGKRIVSGGDSGEIKVWDAADLDKALTLIRHGTEIGTVAFSPDGKLLVSVSSSSKEIKVWDTVTGAEIIAFSGNAARVTCAAFSPDGKHIVSAGVDGAINIFDSASGNEVMTLKGNSGILVVSFSSDGKLLASGCFNNTIKIWDAVTGTLVMALRGHNGPINSVAFSPDGNYLVSSSLDGTVRVWNITTGRETMTRRGHEGRVYSVVFTPDGKQIISGSEDGTVKVWDVTVNRELTEFLGHESVVGSVVFSPDGRRLVSRSIFDGKVKIWDVTSAAEIMTLSGGSYRRDIGFDSIALSSDGKRIASIGAEHAIVVWDAETGAEVMTFGREDESVRCLAFSPDGRRIVSGSNDGKVKLWDVARGEEIVTWVGGGNGVFSVAISPDGQRVVSGHRNEIVKVWDAATGAKLMNLIGHRWHILSIAFSPDGKRLVTGGEDRTVRIWDVVTGKELLSLSGHGDRVCSVAFSPDGRRLVTAGMDGRVRLWDSSTGNELLTLRAEFDVICAAFSPDGKAIAGGTAGNSVVLWESAAPAGGYGPRKTAEAARRIIDELYNKHGFYGKVIDNLKADNTLDESVRKVALQISNARLWEDEEKTEE